MNERLISSSKVEGLHTRIAELEQQLSATDAARIAAERDRDNAYTRIGEQGARNEELEALVRELDARTSAPVVEPAAEDAAAAPDTSDAGATVVEGGQGEGGSDLQAAEA